MHYFYLETLMGRVRNATNVKFPLATPRSRNTIADAAYKIGHCHFSDPMRRVLREGISDRHDHPQTYYFANIEIPFVAQLRSKEEGEELEQVVISFINSYDPSQYFHNWLDQEGGSSGIDGITEMRLFNIREIIMIVNFVTKWVTERNLLDCKIIKNVFIAT